MSRPRRCRRRPILRLERLEERTLLATFVVNSNGDQPDGDPSDGVCDVGSAATGYTGQCTLRAAVQQANALPGSHSIRFQLPAGQTVIRTAGGIRVGHNIQIDGYTQPGSATNSNGLSSGINAQLQVVLVGPGTQSGISGLILSGDQNEVRGLVFQNFDVAIRVNGDNNRIAGNFIGTDRQGRSARPNRVGIHVGSTAEYTVIGGQNSEEWNLISGNMISTNLGVNDGGIAVLGKNTSILGNLIGTDARGTQALPNKGGIILDETAENTQIVGNVISGNHLSGVEIFGGKSTVLAANLIGSDVTGRNPVPNQWGVLARNGAEDIVLASSPPASTGPSRFANGNLVAFNRASGIVAFTHPPNTLPPVGLTVQAGSIHSNGRLGIDLAKDGPTLNDDGDFDSGPNELQNYPEIRVAGPRVVRGTVDGIAGQEYVVQVYGNEEPDPSGFGEGQVFLGSTTVTIPPGGTAEFVIIVPAGPRARYPVITATATEKFEGNTSEFSPAWSGFTVNSTSDRPDRSPGDGRCDTGRKVTRTVQGQTVTEPECTLRAALVEANATPTPDTVAFDIPAGDQNCTPNGRCTIKPRRPLPPIVHPVTINGYTQPGARPNQQPTGNALDSIIQIAIDGSMTRATGNRPPSGLVVLPGGSGTIIQGLAIHSFPGYGVHVRRANRVVIGGNYLGTDATGRSARANLGGGVRIDGGSETNVGGIVPELRNLISGNRAGSRRTAGVIVDQGARLNSILGNLIGTDVTGQVALGNGYAGVWLKTGTIATRVEQNIIGDSRGRIVGSTCGVAGIVIGGTRNDSVRENRIGVGVGGAAVPNMTGICVVGATNLVLAQNTVALNLLDGVSIDDTDGPVRLVNNSIGAVGGVAAGNGASGVSIQDSRNVRIIGGTVAHNRDGIQAVRARRLRIVRTQITDQAGAGLVLEKSGDVRVHRVQILRNQKSGISISDSTDVRLIRSTIRRNQRNGVLVRRSKQIHLVSTTVDGNGADGIRLLAVQQTRLRQVRSTANQANGLQARNTQDVTVDQSTFDGNQRDGIRLLATKRVRVTRSELSNNGDNGVSVIGKAERNEIVTNTYVLNGAMDIDLGDDGGTPNDPGDADRGPNRLQNKPEISHATVVGGQVWVRYRIDSTPQNAAYPITVEFYRAPQGLIQRHPRVKRLYGAQQAGQWVWTNLGNIAQVGDRIAAIAIDRQGNTSEFESEEVKDGGGPGLPFDFGDAPEAADPRLGTPGGYPVTIARDGAAHLVVPGIGLGGRIDNEGNGQPTSMADGDDRAGEADEDGIRFLTGRASIFGQHAIPALLPGPVTLTATVRGGGLLQGWIDLNRDGDWDDPGEQIFRNLSVQPGVNRLSFTLPSSAAAGMTYARFRLSRQPGLGPGGVAPDGEVEDYAVMVVNPPGAPLDFGDAPSSYGTTLAEDGARHAAVGPRLGGTVDTEADGMPTTAATGDDAAGMDDEDGLEAPCLAVPGGTLPLLVTASQSAVLDAWADLDGDGRWTNGERFADGLSLRAGRNVVPLRVPETLPAGGAIMTRLRISTYGVASPTGAAPDGEVEDHAISVGPIQGRGNVTAVVQSGQLLIQGDGQPNFVHIHPDGTGRVTVHTLGTTLNGSTQPLLVTQPIRRVRVSLGGGNDVLVISPSRSSRGRLPQTTVGLGAGSDLLSVASTLFGGRLLVQPGPDDDCVTVVDTRVDQGLSINESRGDASSDRVVLASIRQPILSGAAMRPVRVRLGDGTNQLTLATSRLSGPVRIIGGMAADEVRLVDTLLARGVDVLTNGGVDEVIVERLTVRGNPSSVLLGEDDDRLAVDDARFLAELLVVTGDGDDQVLVERNASLVNRTRFQARLRADLGSGNDQLRIGLAGVPGASADFLAELLVDGGPGTDTYEGPRAAGTDSNGNTSAQPPQVQNFE